MTNFSFSNVEMLTEIAFSWNDKLNCVIHFSSKMMEANVKIYGESTTHVMLIHGLAGLMNSWEKNRDVLASQHTVYEVELPDYADSDRGYNIEQYVDYIEKLIARLKLEAVILIGNSMGGQIASFLAAKRPEIVKKLILSGPSGIFCDMQNASPFFIQHPDAESIQGIGESLFYDTSLFTKQLIEEVLAYYSNHKRFIGFLRTAKKMKASPLEEVLPRIVQPTLIVWGKNDQIIPVKSADVFHALIENSRLMILDKCGHAPQIEKAETFNRAVLDFCKETT